MLHFVCVLGTDQGTVYFVKQSWSASRHADLRRGTLMINYIPLCLDSAAQCQGNQVAHTCQICRIAASRTGRHICYSLTHADTNNRLRDGKLASQLCCAAFARWTARPSRRGRGGSFCHSSCCSWLLGGLLALLADGQPGCRQLRATMLFSRCRCI